MRFLSEPGVIGETHSCGQFEMMKFVLENDVWRPNKKTQPHTSSLFDMHYGSQAAENED